MAHVGQIKTVCSGPAPPAAQPPKRRAGRRKAVTVRHYRSAVLTTTMTRIASALDCYKDVIGPPHRARLIISVEEYAEMKMAGRTEEDEDEIGTSQCKIFEALRLTKN